MQPHRSCDGRLPRTPLLQHAQAWPPDPCTIPATGHLHSACIQLAGNDLSLPGAKSQLLHLKLGLGEEQAGFTFSFQTVDQVAYLLFPINLTQHFSGKNIHPGHGGPRFNSLLHLREDKLIFSGHTLPIRFHKGTFSSSYKFVILVKKLMTEHWSWEQPQPAALLARAHSWGWGDLVLLCALRTASVS